MALEASRNPLPTIPDLHNLPLILAIVYAIEVVIVLPILLRALPAPVTPNSNAIAWLFKTFVFYSGAIFGLTLAFKTHVLVYMTAFAIPSFLLIFFFL
jgi:hypothetical protein